MFIKEAIKILTYSLTVNKLCIKACEGARTIVIMSSGASPSVADAATLRAIIALKTFPKLVGHIVAQVNDKEMEALIKVSLNQVKCCTKSSNVG